MRTTLFQSSGIASVRNSSLSRPWRFAVVLAVAAAIAPVASAQEDPNVMVRAVPGYYSWFQADDVTMKVHVWGAIGSAGMWEVPVGMRFMDLISLAGGPEIGTRDDKTNFTLRIRVERVVDGATTIVFDQTMKNSITILEDDFALQDQDMILVESLSKARVTWRSWLAPFTTIASLFLLTDRLIDRL